jgi:putative transposase
MSKSRFTEAQMVKILRETDKVPVAEVVKKCGVSEQTIYVWRKRYGQMEAADVKQLRTLKQATQALSQLRQDETRGTLDAVPGNIATQLFLRVGIQDAAAVEAAVAPYFSAETLARQGAVPYAVPFGSSP